MRWLIQKVLPSPRGLSCQESQGRVRGSTVPGPVEFHRPREDVKIILGTLAAGYDKLRVSCRRPNFKTQSPQFFFHLVLT